jgi:SAM-dependent methyltransferase
METRREKYKERWINVGPQPGLTWGRWVSGRPFIEKVEQHGVFGGNVLEIGPGYGRLLQAAIELGVRFKHWTGVDLSAQNVNSLARQFPQATFIEGDIEIIDLDVRFDGALSSLTFKHFAPDFVVALSNVATHLEPAGRVAFDLLEGKRTTVEADKGNYLRWYERDEIERLVPQSGMRLVAFDEVEHEPGWTRLLVVCENTAD